MFFRNAVLLHPGQKRCNDYKSRSAIQIEDIDDDSVAPYGLIPNYDPVLFHLGDDLPFSHLPCFEQPYAYHEESKHHSLD
jgi:hypothetical protein